MYYAVFNNELDNSGKFLDLGLLGVIMITGEILSIDESAFGGEILTINYEESTIESRGFINGRTIPDIVQEGDIVEFEIYFNELSNQHYAKVLGLYDYPIYSRK